MSAEKVIVIPPEAFEHPTGDPVRDGDCGPGQCCRRIYGKPRGKDTKVRRCKRHPAYNLGITKHYLCAVHHPHWIISR